MSGDTTPQATPRDGSRLEVDHDGHCKWCGVEIADLSEFGIYVELCPECLARRFELAADAVRAANDEYSTDLGPDDLGDPPGDWDLSDDLWYRWSASVQAQYENLNELRDGEEADSA